MLGPAATVDNSRGQSGQFCRVCPGVLSESPACSLAGGAGGGGRLRGHSLHRNLPLKAWSHGLPGHGELHVALSEAPNQNLHLVSPERRDARGSRVREVLLKTATIYFLLKQQQWVNRVQ